MSCRSRASPSREASSARQRVAVRQALEEIRGEHGVEQVDMAAQLARQARGRAHQVGQELQELRVGAQQREQLHAGRQPGHELVEQPKRARRGPAAPRSACRSAGISSVSSSRARVLRVARMWP